MSGAHDNLFLFVFSSRLIKRQKSSGLPEWCLLHDLLAGGDGRAHILLRKGHDGSASATGASAWPPEGRAGRKMIQYNFSLKKGEVTRFYPHGLLIFHAISGRVPSKGREYEWETEHLINELLYWWTEVLASLKCSALPHDAERLCPPPLLLPRVSSAQELGVFQKQYQHSVVNKEPSVCLSNLWVLW